MQKINILEAEKWHKHFDSCCEFDENGYSDLVKCPYCGSENIKDQNYSYINSIVCEYEYYCEECKEVVGGWGYGYAHD